jgi:hypothetical protein
MASSMPIRRQLILAFLFTTGIGLLLFMYRYLASRGPR